MEELMNQQRKNSEIVNLISLKPGEKAAFVGIQAPFGGYHHHTAGRRRGLMSHHHHHGFQFPLMQRLEAMGIRPGVMIKKVSNHFLRGPVIIEIGKTQLAIGHGMAVKILVNKRKDSQ
jgi:Fe2+ transport system protein FeoA